MFVKAIHKLSRRGRRNLITVNCPALPETILESELFGYRKGAFTLEYLNRLLDKTGGNVSAAAQLSGMKRQTLQKIIKRYGIDVQRLRS